MSTRASRRRRTVVAALAGVTLLASLAGCTDTDPAPDPTSTSSSPDPSVEPSVPPTEPVELSMSLWGTEAELDAFGSAVHSFDPLGRQANITLDARSDYDRSLAALKTAKSLPDLFLLRREDVSWFTERGLTQPVGDLLDERDVPFGDGFNRDAMLAMSFDDALQCMPLTFSPMLIFYNRDLVDFTRMANREIDVPKGPNSWTFEQFAAAADFATRPRRGTRGVYIDPSVKGLTPFIESGGGSVFDDESSPTSLEFSSDASQAALAETLTLLRDPRLTLTDEQLEEAPAITWFERGKLGMVAGFRDWVPRLRRVQGLDFDVIAMPSLGSNATIGDLNAMCMSAKTENISAAANLLAYMASAQAMTPLARTGGVVPTNNEVSASDDFIQKGRLPASASLFTRWQRNVIEPPLIESWSDLDRAVASPLSDLLERTVLDEETLARLTERIDLASQGVLTEPEPTPSNASSS